MSSEYKVLQISDIEEVLGFEQAIVAASDLNENEKMMAGWHAKWRREALEHYLPQGWCMACWETTEAKRQLKGYFIAQPFLFMQGRTQTLWVEHVQADSKELRHEMIDIAYRMSREKHLQAVLFADEALGDEAFANYKRKKDNHQILEVPTTKGS